MRFPALAALACASLAAAWAQSHTDYRAEAEAAYHRKDFPAALAATRSALELRPDSPRYLHNLAALATLTGDEAAAYEALRRLAGLGVVTAIERDPDLATLQGTAEWRRILSLFSANREPRGEARRVAELPGRTGIIEGIAYRPRTGDTFFGDVHHRCIWRRDKEGSFTRFTAENEELFGVFGIALDEARGVIWAATSAVPEMMGFEPAMKGHAALVAFELATGEIKHMVPVPDDGRPHQLGDLCVAPDGTVYATDSASPIVWKLIPDAEEPQKIVDDTALSSIQGIVFEGGTLLISDYANGLFALAPSTGRITALKAPATVTLLGIDGLVAIPGGLVAIQNGVNPQRVLRIALAPELTKIIGVEVLASGLDDFSDLGLVTLMEDRPTFIAHAGWDAFAGGKTKPGRGQPVRVLHLDLTPGTQPRE